MLALLMPVSKVAEGLYNQSLKPTKGLTVLPRSDLAFTLLRAEVALPFAA